MMVAGVAAAASRKQAQQPASNTGHGESQSRPIASHPAPSAQAIQAAKAFASTVTTQDKVLFLTKFMTAIEANDTRSTRKIIQSQSPCLSLIANTLHPTTLFGSTFTWSPLHAAAYQGNTELVESLLSLGADVELEDTWYGGRPLAWAAYSGHADLCRLLVEKYAADRTATNRDNQTALDVCIAPMDPLWIDILKEPPEPVHQAPPHKVTLRLPKMGHSTAASVSPATPVISPATVEPVTASEASLHKVLKLTIKTENALAPTSSTPVSAGSSASSPAVKHIKVAKKTLDFSANTPKNASATKAKVHAQPETPLSRETDVTAKASRVVKTKLQRPPTPVVAKPSIETGPDNLTDAVPSLIDSAEKQTNVVAFSALDDAPSVPNSSDVMDMDVDTAPVLPLAPDFKRRLIRTVGLVGNNDLLRVTITTDAFDGQCMQVSRSVQTLSLRVLLTPPSAGSGTKLTLRAMHTAPSDATHVYHIPMTPVSEDLVFKPSHGSLVQDALCHLKDGMNAFEFMVLAVSPVPNSARSPDAPPRFRQSGEDKFTLFINRV